MAADFDPTQSVIQTGQPVQFEAVVAAGTAGQAYGTPTGTVSFALNGTTVSTVTLGSTGQALYTLDDPPAQMDIVTATYSGDASFAPADATGNVRVVAPGPIADVTSSDAPGAAVAGEPVRIAVKYATAWAYTEAAPGRLTAQLCLSADDDFDPADPVLATAVRSVHSSKVTTQPTLAAKRLPADLADGDYRLYLRLTDSAGRVNVTNELDGITVAAPVGKLAVASVVPETASAPATGPRWVRVTLTNAGNVKLATSVTASVVASDATGATTQVGRVVRPVHLQAGKSITLLVRLRRPDDLSAGAHPLQLSVLGGGLNDTLDVGASMRVV